MSHALDYIRVTSISHKNGVEISIEEPRRKTELRVLFFLFDATLPEFKTTYRQIGKTSGEKTGGKSREVEGNHEKII